VVSDVDLVALVMIETGSLEIDAGRMVEIVV